MRHCTKSYQNQSNGCRIYSKRGGGAVQNKCGGPAAPHKIVSICSLIIVSIFLACCRVAKKWRKKFCPFVGPPFCGAPVRPNMLNLPKSASAVHTARRHATRVSMHTAQDATRQFCRVGVGSVNWVSVSATTSAGD